MVSTLHVSLMYAVFYAIFLAVEFAEDYDFYGTLLMGFEKDTSPELKYHRQKDPPENRFRSLHFT